MPMYTRPSPVPFILAVFFAVVCLGGCGEGSGQVRTPTKDAAVGDVGVPDAAQPGAEDARDAGVDPAGDVGDATVAPDAAAPEDSGAPNDVVDRDSADAADGDAAETDAPDTQRDSTPPDAAAPPDATAPAGPFVLWMAPDGEDTRDGRTPQTAIQTLGRAHQILKGAAPTTDVEVRIAPGRYRGQKVVWTFSVPGHTVTLTRLAGEQARPVFDGCLSADNCPGGTWFILQRKDGQRTGIVFHYLHIENYQTAISFNGGRDAESQSNGGNRIYGCYFNRIGNVFNPALAPSTAAVRLVNSDDNEIANNHFVNIINTTSPGLLHAIYAAHMSDRNQIARNRFENNAGDPVRLRDFSNDNVIQNNRFKKVGIEAGYTEWYCDHAARTDCTKPTPECPSWGNQFRDNELNGNYACAQLATFKYFQGDSTAGCAPPSAEARRLRTSGNTHTARPCE